MATPRTTTAYPSCLAHFDLKINYVAATGKFLNLGEVHPEVIFSLTERL